ncbi:MAG: hypothetical protein C0625_09700 [Arcobacter sp.]|nr:MAG: hypothetical protein C0625_09700 [Arcobacter sp.]
METKAEEQLQTALINNYLVNLNFLREVDYELFKKVELLSEYIEKGHYQERFTLEFLEKDGEFDIYDNKNNKYLYEKKPKRFKEKIKSKIRLDEKNTINLVNFTLFENYSDSFEKNIDTKQGLINILHSQMYEYGKIIPQKKEEKKFKHVKKVIFLGTLLARHMEDIKNSLNSTCHFIYEKNLEIFRLSLFTFNYEILGLNSLVVFSIMDDLEITKNKFKDFFNNYIPFENNCIKFVDIINDETLLNSLLDVSHKSNVAIFDHQRWLHRIAKDTFTNIADHYNILTTLNKNLKFKLNDTPILCLGAGPSLEKNMTWLKKEKRNFIVVAMAAVLSKIQKHEIIPDIIISIDTDYDGLKKQFELGKYDYLKDTIFICSSSTPSFILKLFEKEKTFLFDALIKLKDNSNYYEVHSIAEAFLSLFLDINFKNIYLLGFDLTLNQETGSSHFSDYKSNVNHNLKRNNNQKLKSGNSNLFEDIITVKSNLEKEVYSTRLFGLSIDLIKKIVLQFKKEDQNIYNLSDSAAYVKGIKYIEFEELNNKKLAKKDFNLEFIKYLDSISENQLSMNEKKRFKEEKNILEASIFEIKKTKDENQDINSLDDFIKIYENIIFKLTKTKKVISSEIFNNYFILLFQYVYYYFNDKNLKDDKKKLKELEKVLLKQINDLIEDYIEYLNYIVKN